MPLILPKKSKNSVTAEDMHRYNSLQIKYLQAENKFNKFLLQFTNKVLDNISNIQNPTKEELNAALEKARADFEHLQEALEAEKELRDIKLQLQEEHNHQIEEMKPYFMQ